MILNPIPTPIPICDLKRDNLPAMPLLVPRRIETDEMLDDGDEPLDDIERSLRDLRRINAWCGGARAYHLLIRRLLHGRHVDGLTVMDLGTGTSDLVETFSGVTAVGLDLKIAHLAYGSRTGARTTARVGGDARRLPFRDRSADIVTSSHFFHHFDPATNGRILDEALRVSRVGVVVTDTRRHLAPWFFCKMLGWGRLVGRITRFDAPASVLRGYTVEEARETASRTMASRWEVVRVMPYRFGVLLWR